MWAMSIVERPLYSHYDCQRNSGIITRYRTSFNRTCQDDLSLHARRQTDHYPIRQPVDSNTGDLADDRLAPRFGMRVALKRQGRLQRRKRDSIRFGRANETASQLLRLLRLLDCRGCSRGKGSGYGGGYGGDGGGDGVWRRQR